MDSCNCRVALLIKKKLKKTYLIYFHSSLEKTQPHVFLFLIINPSVMSVNIKTYYIILYYHIFLIQRNIERQGGYHSKVVKKKYLKTHFKSTFYHHFQVFLL